MRRRRLIELALIIIVAAVFARWSNTAEVPPSIPRPENLSVAGVKLGMTREQVRAKLGQPLATEDDIGIQGFQKDMYKTTEGWGEPEVTYNSKGLVVRVFGTLPLQWAGGLMDQSATEKDILELFPTAVVRMTPSPHPWRPGEILVPGQSLFIMTDWAGMLSRDRFYGAGLALPYAYEFRHYWVYESGGGSLLATTGKRSDMLTRAKAERAEALGCYFCAKRIKVAIYPESRTDSAATCPTCNNQTVLAGSDDELSNAYLQDVHNAWFEPTGQALSRSPAGAGRVSGP